MQQFQIVAKTFKGLEEVLAEELRRLQAADISIGHRAVSFTGDNEMLYKANLWLRTALSLLRPISTFRATTPDEVYEAVSRIDWDQYMDPRMTFAISATVHSEEFRHSRYITYRVKDAIADWFMEHAGKRPSVSVANPDIQLNIHIADKQCTLSLDSSGEPLYKRGWRVAQTEAPINEVLAAGMLLMAGWDGQCDFVDPMCGSGTLLIEAAMIALNLPPGIYRQHFGFERWKDFDQELFDRLYNDDSAEREFKHHIYGFDIEHKAINIARQNVRSAGLVKHIDLGVCAVTDQEARAERCLIVTNPPYGERLKQESLLTTYEQLGSTLKHKFTGSDAWVITSLREGLFRIGLKPTEKIDLLNGELECTYAHFPLFSGKHKDYKTREARSTPRSAKPAPRRSPVSDKRRPHRRD